MIARVDLRLLRHRLARPVGGSGVGHVDVLVAEVATRDGRNGLRFSFALASSAVPAFHAACELARTLVQGGISIDSPAETWAQLARGFNRTGRGPNYLGLAALDVALWDLAAQARGQPLWRCFGNERPRVPLYQSGGFGAADSIALTEWRIAAAADEGYRAVKLRINGTPADLPRVEAAVLQADRRGLRVMLDVNEKGQPGPLMAFAAGARGLPLEWIEEPFASGALREHRRLAAMSDLPLAGGEHLQGLAEVLPFIDPPLLQTLQPDLAMMGGLSECLRVSQEAERCGLDVAPHFLPGLFAHLGAGLRRLAWLEEFPLLEPLFEGWAEAAYDKTFSPGDAPGHGLRLSAVAQATPVLLGERTGA